MEAVRNILLEEMENSKRLRSNYLKGLGELPKGSLVAKKMGKHIFYYLAYRNGPKVVFKYKGKLQAHEVELFNQAKDRQKNLKKQIKKVNEQIQYLKKVLRVKS